MYQPESRISALCSTLHLSPYQSYVLENHPVKYDLARIARHGAVLYAPHAYSRSEVFKEFCFRIILGPRADLIGPEGMLVFDQRGIKVYPVGCFSAHKDGEKYYADQLGNPMSRQQFAQLIGR